MSTTTAPGVWRTELPLHSDQQRCEAAIERGNLAYICCARYGQAKLAESFEMKPPDFLQAVVLSIHKFAVASRLRCPL